MNAPLKSSRLPAFLFKSLGISERDAGAVFGTSNPGMDVEGLRDRVLDDKYRVIRVIAEGGMGVVAEALHLALEHKVALKFPLVPHGIDEREARGRLLREARAAASIKSEHVCRIFDVCELPSGEPYLVMELLRGKDLGARLGKRMSVREAADLVRQACLGVAEAHARGIVHRDLKPENLFVTQNHLGRPLVKVLDFGISKVPREHLRKERTGVTTRDAMGSPLYMSPEQMLATSDVDARADVWSLGVILYELVSGQSPFDAPSVPQICVKVMRDAPAWLGDVRPDLPEAFVALVHRCLDKDLTRRIASAEELAAELLPFTRGEKDSLGSIRPRDPRATGVAWSGVEAPRPPARNRRVLPALLVGALVGLGVSIAIWSPRIGEGPAPAAAAPAWEPEAKPPDSTPIAAAPSASAEPEVVPTSAPAESAVAPAPSASASARPAALAKPRPRPLRDYVAPPDFTAGPSVVDTSRRDLYEPATQP